MSLPPVAEVLWPRLPQDDPRDQRRKIALMEALHPDVAPLAIITCSPDLHRLVSYGAPKLAEIRPTRLGPLFLASVELAHHAGASDVVADLSAEDADMLLGVPADLTCVLLNDTVPPSLRVKCRAPRHNRAYLDPVRLWKVYLDREAGAGDAPVVMRIEEVAWVQWS